MISIITPTLLRNELVRCCGSLERQTVPWEHIVMVDMPKDEAYGDKVYADILMKIAHPKRTILFCSERHQNYGNTCRHNAYNFCTGDYIGYLDDDDYFTDDALNIFQEVINRSNPDVVVANASMKGRPVFFSKPPSGGNTVQGQYLHKKILGGKPFRWPDTPVGYKSYGVDGEFVDAMSAAAKDIGYAMHNRPVVVIEASSKGKENIKVAPKPPVTVLEDMIKRTVSGTNDSDAHIMTLFGLTLGLKAKNVLELGARFGTTTEALLEACKLTGGILESVDKKSNRYLRKRYKKHPHWRYTISDSLLFLENLPPDRMFDLVLVDDWHDGEHVWKELKLLESHVTKNSLVLLHDTMCWHTEPEYHLHPLIEDGEFGHGGPYWAVIQLDPTKWEWSTIPACNGLTILRKT